MRKRTLPAAVAVLVLSAFFVSSGAPQAKPAPEGYLLNLYHFNIQYVVGDENAMRRIVKQSFEPLVDFYLEHPDWGASFEMQGRMVEYMAEKFPAALDKFRKLVNSGQAELVSFHYGAQLLLAFPGHDQDWSLRINDRILDEHNMERAGVIFAQEAQFGEGYSVMAEKHGYDVGVMTTSQYRWFQDDPRFPYFTVNGMEVLTNKKAVHEKSGIKVKWHFLGDGELVVTGGFSPYFPGLFHKNPIRLYLLEKEMKEELEKGYKPSTITEYVKALRDAGVEPKPLRPVLDSPWRPDDGSGVFQWMGKYATPWEKDYDMRTENWKVRSLLIEAERAGADPGLLEEAWGYMVNAEVSDPSGWFPLPVEVDWDYRMMDKVKETLSRDPSLNMAALRERAEDRPTCTGEVSDPPFRLERWGNAEEASISWSRLEGAPGYCIEVKWSGKGDGGVGFPWKVGTVEYSPAMLEDTVRTIALDETKGKSIHLGLPNGFIGLGGSDYLVRDNAAGCVAAGLYPDQNRIAFEVENAKEEKFSFTFYLFQDADKNKVREFANRINRVSP
ncbi:MAG: hypothetical protein R6V10_05150 [bacterium]